MFSVSEAEAAVIRTAFEQRGELSAVVELRRLFRALTNNVLAREFRTLAEWQPLAVHASDSNQQLLGVAITGLSAEFRPHLS